MKNKPKTKSRSVEKPQKAASSSETEMAIDKPQRLAITREVLRRLYLHSGNRCAFPKCKETMMDDEGSFIGEICHIEAASPGGERFSAQMTNEERRSFENLLLLCHKHHVKTNDVKRYSVPKLKELKASHERKYSQIEEKMYATITDQSLEDEVIEAKNLVKVLGDPDDDRPGEVRRMRRYSARVRELPDETRALLAIAVRRAYENAVRNKDEGGLESMTVNPTEVQKAARLSNFEYREQIRILAEHGLATVEDGEETGRWTMYIAGQGSWHRIPEDIARTCKEHNISLEDVYVHLRFDLLDGVAKDE